MPLGTDIRRTSRCQLVSTMTSVVSAAWPAAARVSLRNVSIQVQLDDLQRVLADFDAGYLLTVDPSTARVKVVSVRPALVDGVLEVSAPGRGSLANVRANSAVTFVWPPREAGFR